jgi:hypothetical protein
MSRLGPFKLYIRGFYKDKLKKKNPNTNMQTIWYFFQISFILKKEDTSCRSFYPSGVDTYQELEL